MKLYRSADVPVDTARLICRESRLAGVVRFFVWCAALAIPVILGWKFDYPWVMWLFAILFICVVPLLLRDVAEQFRATNWVLRIDAHGVWINLRSYKDKVTEAASVFWLGHQEIVSVGRHSERYSTPKRITGPASQGAIGGDIIWHDVFLEFQLIREVPSELYDAVNNLRSQPAPGDGPSGEAMFRSRHYPVWLVSPKVLRITWNSGHGHVVAPRLSRAIAQLESYLRQTIPSERARPNWRKLPPEDINELARELVQVHGAYTEATSLLVRAGGITHAEATAQVQRFEEEGVT